MARYLNPFVCFSCRRCFRRSAARTVERKCPTCGSVAVALSRKFKAPSRADEEQWRKVEFLYRHGFRFQSVYDKTGRVVRYPESLKEARDFVRRYKPGKPAENYAWAAESASEKKRAKYQSMFLRANRKRPRHASRPPQVPDGGS
ncbi:MAG: hypothetical protein H0T46_16025 [Deltaproteobacteria bacterium]|nr:hypothetical protein [Deltaproteobacteria bacterium]